MNVHPLALAVAGWTLMVAAVAFTPARAAENPFVGRWALTLPEGKAGWLGVTQNGETFDAQLLWISGSVLPAEKVTVTGSTLSVERAVAVKSAVIRQILTGQLRGSELSLTSVMVKPSGQESDRVNLNGIRIPDLPPRPDLRTVKFGPPLTLLVGELGTVWTKVDDRDPMGWTLTDGILSNRVTKGQTRRFANLRTKQEFEDCAITVEVRTQEGSNSGIYLRGVYEIQISESYGKPLDAHNMGALYSRITPTVAAEKPIGEWQTLRIVLVQRYVTVELNGKTIIDNQPSLGCTGGALTSDEFRPGPIMLQGDHSNIDYRNLQIRPVLKEDSLSDAVRDHR